MKRFFCLVLAVCLCMTAIVPSACAQTPQPFRDAAEIKNLDQVELLSILGLLSGFEDGTYRPGDFITREQVSKLLALVCTEDPSVLPEHAADIHFNDISASWAALFIAYCAAREMLVGHAGAFRPRDNVSARELCKTLLVLLGHEPGRYTGSDWADNVYIDAMQAGILNGFTGGFSASLSRDNAALLLYNALLCPAVIGHGENGSPIYARDELMNPITYLEYRYGIVRYNQVLTANECADLSGAAPLQEGLSRLSGHIHPFEAATDLSLLGRTVNIYVKGDAVIGQVCADSDEMCLDLTQESFQKLLSAEAFTLAPDCAYYRNYAAADASVLDGLSPTDQVIAIDRENDGVMDALFVNLLTGGTIESVSPLRVSINGRRTAAKAFDSSDTFTEDMAVSCFTVGDTVYVQPVTEEGK